MSFLKWLQQREHGFPQTTFDRDSILRQVYQTIEPFNQWELDEVPQKVLDYGGVFNMEFSPEGKVLVAACEKKSITIFDAITTKQTSAILDAHKDNVNCIKFLNSHEFASCSDDTTVALWDLRNLKNKLRSLHGHSNWVKNIEYSHKDNLLVTSGFDGSIFTWDVKSPTEQGLIYQKVFHTSGLMRCRISPDDSKMVICTTGGYLMIIHSLNLPTLHKDLCGFRPSIFRLMQMGKQYIPQAAKFDHVFSKNQIKNRVELVTDFPTDNDAEVILALQIHPQGHSFLSRNISYDEMTEWSTIHDINEEPEEINEKQQMCSSKRKRKLQVDSDEEHSETTEDEAVISNGINVRRPRRALLNDRTTTTASTSNNQPAVERSESFVPDIWAAEVTVQERAIRQSRTSRNANTVTSYNFVYAISSGVLPAAAPRSLTRTTDDGLLRPGSPYVSTRTDDIAINNTNRRYVSNVENFGLRSLVASKRTPKERKIFENPKKLMYFIQESNKGKGFIKEPCFSSDGRIICSPFDTGVRLLAFNKECSEYPRYQSLNLISNRSPTQLHEVKHITSHSDIVLSTKFSPREPLLVTGCRSGKIVWYRPNL